MNTSNKMRQEPHAPHLEQRPTGDENNAVERGDQPQQADTHQQVIKRTLLIDHLAQRQRQRAVRFGRSGGHHHTTVCGNTQIARFVDNPFPAAGANSQQQHHGSQQHQRGDGESKPERDIALRILRLLSGVGYAFNGQIKPDGKRHRGQRPRPSMRQRVNR